MVATVVYSTTAQNTRQCSASPLGMPRLKLTAAAVENNAGIQSDIVCDRAATADRRR